MKTEMNKGATTTPAATKMESTAPNKMKTEHKASTNTKSKAKKHNAKKHDAPKAGTKEMK